MKSTGLSRENGGETAGERVFTEYVRALARGGEPDPQLLAVVQDGLRSALRGELRRRGLWNSPPHFLGVYGSEDWGDGLEELLSECYTFVFVDRRRSLEAHLQFKDNIDGLVFLNVRHFLHERQKEHDPLGSQVFEVLQSAVRKAVAEGDLHVLAGDPRVRNETVLGFRPDADPSALPSLDFRSLVACWNDDLLPDLVTLRGQKQEEVVQRLRERLADLWKEGAEAFRFKNLIDPLKADVRARWAALLDHATGEPATERDEEDSFLLVYRVQPETRFEDRQLFRKLINCVLEAIERLDVNEKARSYLTTLWQFWRVQATAGPADKQPSHRRIAELLRIPRDRIPELQKTLGRLLEPCQAVNSWKQSFPSTDSGGITP